MSTTPEPQAPATGFEVDWQHIMDHANRHMNRAGCEIEQSTPDVLECVAHDCPSPDTYCNHVVGEMIDEQHRQWQDRQRGTE